MGRENERFLDSKESGKDLERQTGQTLLVFQHSWRLRDWLLTLANHDCQQKKLLNYTHFKGG